MNAKLPKRLKLLDRKLEKDKSIANECIKSRTISVVDAQDSQFIFKIKDHVDADFFDQVLRYTFLPKYDHQLYVREYIFITYRGPFLYEGETLGRVRFNELINQCEYFIDFQNIPTESNSNVNI